MTSVTLEGRPPASREREAAALIVEPAVATARAELRQDNAQAHASPLLERTMLGGPVALATLEPDVGRCERRGPVGGLLKRAMDIALGLIALALLAPIMLMIAVLVRIVMGGPIIFSHDRIGFNGRVFRCYKFRTMIVNADEVLGRHLASNVQAAEEWGKTQKLAQDPRVGCLGTVLRKASLDELPQLFNILRGDMSLVGPRPVVPEEIYRYGAHARRVLTARPGLTGMWQANGRSRLSYSTRVALDYFYVRRWSPWLDLQLLLKTIPAVLHFDDTT